MSLELFKFIGKKDSPDIAVVKKELLEEPIKKEPFIKGIIRWKGEILDFEGGLNTGNTNYGYIIEGSERKEKFNKILLNFVETGETMSDDGFYKISKADENDWASYIISPNKSHKY